MAENFTVSKLPKKPHYIDSNLENIDHTCMVASMVVMCIQSVQSERTAQ